MPSLPPRLAAIVGVERLRLAPLALIGLILGGAAGAFAYAGGWLSPDRLTPVRIVDALSARGGDPIGHRRNHSKGICFLGTFDATGAGTRLSTAPMLAAGQYPVIGRFAIAVGNPLAPDAAGRVRSMAIDIRTPDGQDWRSGMNTSPVFVVATLDAFYQLTRTADIVPATGKPDPKATDAFIAAHKETAAFGAWARSAPWTPSFADESYYGLNAFVFVDAQGTRRAVRWSMQATEPVRDATPAELAAMGPDFLAQDLKQRLGQQPLRWHLIVTLAAPNDPTNDATKAWPADREHVDVGTLTIRQARDEVDGPCRDINYDPLILPQGIEASDDPLLPARSSAYANSFDRRTAEARFYTPATVKEATR